MEKFKELVHLVIHQCKNDPKKLGTIRLNKILWFSDVHAYMETGASITGTQYVRRKHGPVPAHILQVLDELKEEGRIEVAKPVAPYEPWIFKSLREADKSAFSDHEQSMVAYLTKTICDDHSANSISELTHDDIWQTAEEGEVIPLSTMLVRLRGDFRSEIQTWASEVVGQLMDAGSVHATVEQT